MKLLIYCINHTNLLIECFTRSSQRIKKRESYVETSPVHPFVCGLVSEAQPVKEFFAKFVKHARVS